MNNKIQYAMGFILSPDKKRVALICKNKPARLVGMLTGIGGHREQDESFIECLIREVEEEAGVITAEGEWLQFATVSTDEMYMPCYVMYSDKIDDVRTMESEKVSIFNVNDLSDLILAPLALDLVWLTIDRRKGILNLTTHQITPLKENI